MPQSLGGHPETQIGQKRVDTRRGRQTLSTLRIKRQQVEFIGYFNSLSALIPRKKK